MNTPDLLVLFFMFGLGSIVGSFLNVCIVRMPKEESIVLPASHCPQCKHPIAWIDNIPLLSFLFLNGRCRYCRNKISGRYFLVELTTGLTFAAFYFHFGLTSILWPYVFMAACFIVATFVDLEHRIIPDQISVGGLLVGIVFSMMVPSLHERTPSALEIGRIVLWFLSGLCVFLLIVARLIKREKVTSDEMETFIWVGGTVAVDALLNWLIKLKFSGIWIGIPEHLQGLEAALIGFMVGGSMTYLMGILGEFIFRKEAIGGGDVKLMAMIGAFLGWKSAILTFFIAPFFGAVVGLIEFIRTRDRTIAYGPFLALGALVSLFWGNQIIDWIMRGYSLY